MALETPEDDELLLSDQILPRDFQLPSPQLHQVNSYTIKLYRNVVLYVRLELRIVCRRTDVLFTLFVFVRV